MPIQDITKILSSNTYPGRGIIIGRTSDGTSARIIYFIMGRSENSRNRVFTYTEDGIRTEAFDPAKMQDPSLIIYHPVRFFNGRAIVTNGDQTDTVRDNFAAGHGFRHGLRGRRFEPDAPNFTPRISGVVYEDGAYELSILKSDEGDDSCCCRLFYSYDAPKAGEGRFISTYKHDGNPIPSFEGEPIKVSVDGEFDAFAESVWNSLNADNKVSLYACDIDIATGEKKQRIINKNN